MFRPEVVARVAVEAISILEKVHSKKWVAFSESSAPLLTFLLPHS